MRQHLLGMLPFAMLCDTSAVAHVIGSLARSARAFDRCVWARARMDRIIDIGPDVAICFTNWFARLRTHAHFEGYKSYRISKLVKRRCDLNATRTDISRTSSALPQHFLLHLMGSVGFRSLASELHAGEMFSSR